MATKLEDRDWNLLLRRIKDGKCTPIIGDGLFPETLTKYVEIAKKWSEESNFPIVGQEEDLQRVAQYLTVYNDPMYPREELIKEIKPLTPPDFSLTDEPHAVLANLPLPIYLTTNFNNFMHLALKSKNKDVKREFCKWNETVTHYDSAFDDPGGFEPTVANPVLYHLLGHEEIPESLVLTEDDHLDFLVKISDENVIPPRIQRAIASTSLMILGYTPQDWSLKVLFRGLINSLYNPRMNRISVTVQLPPISDDPDDPRQQRLQQYFDDYFGGVGIRPYWGTTKEFITELNQRWRDFADAS